MTHGMVGAINPSRDENVTVQMELAKAAGVGLLPNETLTPEEKASISAAAERIMPEEHKPALSAGEIAGIVLGSIVCLALAGAIIFFFRRNRKQTKALLRIAQSQAGSHTSSARAPPSEMQVDGVTYVPASDPRALHSSYPPSYQQFSPDLRPKSAETTLSGAQSPNIVYSPTLGWVHQQKR